MDKPGDYMSWSHGMGSCYSSCVFNASKLPLPSTSFVKSHSQYQNCPDVRCPEPRRPYGHITYQPFKYFQHENYHGRPYFSINSSYSQNNNQLPVCNYYSSSRISDCKNCSNFENNSCVRNDLTNIYRNNCNYNTHCVETCPDLDVRQFLSTWQDKEDDDDDNVVSGALEGNNESNFVYHVQDPFLLDYSRRDSCKGNNVGISKAFSGSCINEENTDIGFGSTPFYNIREGNVGKTFNSSDYHNVPMNYKRDSEVYYSYWSKQAYENDVDLSVIEKTRVMYAPYFTERSHYNLTSSLESEEHFDDINTRNKEPYKNGVHPMIHERYEAVCYNENKDFNLRNQWSKAILNNIQNENNNNQRKNFWNKVDLENVTDDKVKAYESVARPSNFNNETVADMTHRKCTKDVALFKSENENFGSLIDRALISVNSTTISNSYLCNSEKCQLINEEVSSEDIYISITSSSDLTNGNRAVSGTNSAKNSVKGLKKNVLNTNLNIKDREINEICLVQENITDSSSCGTVKKEFCPLEEFKKKKMNSELFPSLRDHVTLEKNKLDESRVMNESLYLEKVMCDVQTQVRQSDFKQKGINCNRSEESSELVNLLVVENTSNELNYGKIDEEVLLCGDASEASRDSVEVKTFHNAEEKSFHRMEKHDAQRINVKFKLKNCPLKPSSRNKRLHFEKKYFQKNSTDVNSKEANDVKSSFIDMNFNLRSVDLDERANSFEENSNSSSIIMHNHFMSSHSESLDEIESDFETDLLFNYKEASNRINMDDLSLVKKNGPSTEILSGVDNSRENSKLKLGGISNKIPSYDEKSTKVGVNDNLLLLAHCSQEYSQIQIERMPEEENALDAVLNKSHRKKVVNGLDFSRSLKCSLRWDRIFSNSLNKSVNESGDVSIDLGPAKIELRLPSNLHVKSQWRIVRSDENKSISSSIVHVKRLILKRKFNYKDKIPKMIIKRNDDKEYISYIKTEASYKD